MNPTACPCQSAQPYAECCHPFHLGEAYPATAEQLMRSRYTAYVLGNIDYLIATTVPAQQPLLDRPAMQQWSQTTDWAGLEIVEVQANLGKNHSRVRFNAFFNSENGRQAHHELSLFVNIDRRWYFFDPTVPLPTQKSPCLCGSGKKFKHCCGGF